tara:strand:- start:1543 stop:2913 length:1371 start_codon:yes stop_codon:yes gene_type:complete
MVAGLWTRENLVKFIEDIDNNDINERDESGWTPLIMVSRYSNSEFDNKDVQILLEKGADVNLQTKDGWSALMFASRYSNRGSNEKTVEMLLEKGANVNIKSKREKWTALMLAADNSYSESTEKTVQMLLDKGADVNAQNIRGWTPLMVASRGSSGFFQGEPLGSTEKTVEILLEKGADVNLKKNDGWTALMLSSRYSNTDSKESTVRLLLDNGADIDAKNNYGSTALALASWHSNVTSSEGTVELLIEKGANINIQSEDGWTALMYSAMNTKKMSSLNTVRILIENGADINVKNSDKNTAYNLSDSSFVAKLLNPDKHRVRVNITKTVQFFDPLSHDKSDIHIGKYIEDNADNIVIVYRTKQSRNNYFFSKRSIIKKQLEETEVSKYDLYKIAFTNSEQFCNMEEFFDNYDGQMFSITKFNIHGNMFNMALVAYPSVNDNPEKSGGNRKRILRLLK